MWNQGYTQRVSGSASQAGQLVSVGSPWLNDESVVSEMKADLSPIRLRSGCEMTKFEGVGLPQGSSMREYCVTAGLSLTAIASGRDDE